MSYSLSTDLAAYFTQLYMNEVVFGTLFGVLMGPHAANVFDPRNWGSHERIITLEFTRIVLATGLFAIGVALPPKYMVKHVKGLLVMVVPTMAFGWLVIFANLTVKDIPNVLACSTGL